MKNNNRKITINNTLSIITSIINRIQKNNYKSYDPMDVLGTPLFLYLRSRKNDIISTVGSKIEPKNKTKIFFRKILAPLYQSKLFINTVRTFLCVKKQQIPKTFGLLAQGYLSLYRSTHNKIWKRHALDMLTWLEQHPSKKYNTYAWGIPYPWQVYKNLCIPAYEPESTMTAVCGLAFIEAYEMFKIKKYLTIACHCCEYFIHHLNIDNKDDELCFSYTAADTRHVINVNYHCGALLYRTALASGNTVYKKYADKAFNYSNRCMNRNGSWYYGKAKNEKYVDNYHTGDNLEYLIVSKQRRKYNALIHKGQKYYLNTFFNSAGFPRYTSTSKYPGDIHSSAQSLITLSLLSKYCNNSVTANQHSELYADMAFAVLEWTKKVLFNKKDCFYYRIYDTGAIDKNSYFAWGDAYMVKGLAYYIEMLTNLRS